MKVLEGNGALSHPVNDACFRLLELPNVVLPNGAAIFNDRHMITCRFQFGEKMRADDQGLARLSPSQERTNVHRFHRVETIEGFVEENQFRIAQEGLRNGQAPSHSVGQGMYFFVGAVDQIQAIKPDVDLVREGSGIHALQPSIIPQDFPDACVAGKLCILGEERYAASVYRGMEGAQAENVDLSPLDLEETHHGRERRCFSGAVAAHQGEGAAARNGEIESIECDAFSVLLHHAFQLEGRAQRSLLEKKT